MKNSLRRLTAPAGLVAALILIAEPASLAVAQPTPLEGAATGPAVANAAAGSERTIGDGLLAEAAARLERRTSITARLRHQTAIHGEQLYGIGRYWQQGSADDLRVRMELQLGPETSLMQISNGRFLWSDRSLPMGRTVTRVDLRQLRSDPVLAAANINDIRPGQANWSVVQSDFAASCGGIPSMLASLRESFSFYPPQAMRLIIPGTNGSDSVPYFAIVGRWKSEKLAALLGHQTTTGNRDPQVPVSTPERLPEEVLLLFGQADLFPYRIEYRRLESLPDGAPMRAPVYQLSNRPTAVLELSDVTFDVLIPPSHFDYVPPNVDWVDHTSAMIEQFRRRRQQNVATREVETVPIQPVR
jgi:hypothetical protein